MSRRVQAHPFLAFCIEVALAFGRRWSMAVSCNIWNFHHNLFLVACIIIHPHNMLRGERCVDAATFTKY
jgi:hypothetical protein